MLANNAAYKMGTPACPLGELYRTLPCKDVRLGARMTSIRFENNRAVGIELAGEFLPADAVILAINYPALEKWIPPELAARDSRFANLEKLQSVPILGAHLWFDRPVISTPHAALISGQLQWLFRKPNSDGRAVHGVISAARDYLQRDTNELLNLFTNQIRQTFPEAQAPTSSAAPSSSKNAPPSPPPPAQINIAPPNRHPQMASKTYILPATSPAPAGPPPWKAPSVAATSPPKRFSQSQTRFWSPTSPCNGPPESSCPADSRISSFFIWQSAFPAGTA